MASAPQREPAEFKRATAGLYDCVAARYGAGLFGRAGARLVDLASIPPGARILDVATGRGAVLFPAAERVGPTGHVLGIDLSAKMVHETAAEIRRRDLRNVEVRVMDAEALSLPSTSFDFALCSFAIFIFPDLARALAELRRVLRAGGTLGVALGGANGDPRWKWHGELIQRYAPHWWRSIPASIVELLPSARRRGRHAAGCWIRQHP